MDYGTTLFLANDLRFVEKRLRTIIDILGSNTYRPSFLLYSIRFDIGLDTKNIILHTTEKMLSEIQQLKAEFGLEEDVEGLKRKIDVYLEEIWTTIADTRPEKMLGHGKMSKPDEESVRSYVLKLLSMTEHLLFNKPMKYTDGKQ